MLRRPVCLLMVLLLALSAAACKKGGRPKQPVTTGFCCDVNVKYKDMNVRGSLKRTLAGTLSFDIVEPETIKGLSMQLSGETVTLKLHGLSFDVNPELIPQSALAKSLLSVLDAAIGDREGGEISKDGLLTKGSTLSGEFEILSDPETGRLLTIRMPSTDLTAEFSNFVLVQ